MKLIEKILFTKNECELIINYNKNNNQIWKYNDRDYESESIYLQDETMWIFNKLKDFFEKETDIEIRNLNKIMHFHKYIKGDWFGKHNDIRDGRLYAVGVLLNDNFVGGDFILYNPIEHILNKKIGNTYLFDVRIEHEITPILSGERYSLLWFLQSEHVKFDVNKLI